ncbi:unnamed protein product, partial [Ilex paraguariensis]
MIRQKKWVDEGAEGLKNTSLSTRMFAISALKSRHFCNYVWREVASFCEDCFAWTCPFSFRDLNRIYGLDLVAFARILEASAHDVHVGRPYMYTSASLLMDNACF